MCGKEQSNNMYVCAIILAFLTILIIICVIYRRNKSIECYTLADIDNDVIAYILNTVFPTGCVLLSHIKTDPSTYLPQMSDTSWKMIDHGKILGSTSSEVKRITSLTETEGHELTKSEYPSHIHKATYEAAQNYTHSHGFGNTFELTEHETDIAEDSAFSIRSSEYTLSSDCSHTHPETETGDVEGKCINGATNAHKHSIKDNTFPLMYVYAWERIDNNTVSFPSGISLSMDAINAIMGKLFPTGYVIISKNKLDLSESYWKSLSGEFMFVSTATATEEGNSSSDGSLSKTDDYTLKAGDIPNHKHLPVFSEEVSVVHSHSLGSYYLSLSHGSRQSAERSSKKTMYQSDDGDAINTSAEYSDAHSHSVNTESCGGDGGHSHELKLPLINVYAYVKL